MLVVLRRCIFQTESCPLRRLFSVSTAWRVKQNRQKFLLNTDENLATKTEGRKLLKVALLGLPNVGKSTLVNKLTRRMVCPTSSKVHTTTHKAEAHYIQDNTQIVFMDTPGLTTEHERKMYQLVETFQKDPVESIVEADVIGIIQDVKNIYTRSKISASILNVLKFKRDDTALLLIFNKVDKLKHKAMLLDLTRQVTNNTEYPKFDDIFMVSALSGDGIADLRNYLLDSAKLSDWKYEEELFSDQSLECIMEETVRAKLLDVLHSEIPYKIKVKVEHFDIGDDGSVYAVVLLECPNDRYVKIVLGPKGITIKNISSSVEDTLRNAFRTAVIIKIAVVNVKVKDKSTF